MKAILFCPPLLCAAIALAQGATDPSPSISMTGEGHLRGTTYTPQGEVSLVQDFPYRVSYFDGRMSLIVDRTIIGTDDYHLISDSSQVYVARIPVNRPPPPQRQSISERYGIPPTPSTASTDRARVSITPGCHPLAAYYLSIPWFANFASACRKDESRFPAIWGWAREAPNLLGIESAIEWTDAPHSFPLSARWWLSPRLALDAARDPRLERTKLEESDLAAWRRGNIHNLSGKDVGPVAEYRVTRQVMVGGHPAPEAYQLEIYLMRRTADGLQRWLAARYDGEQTLRFESSMEPIRFPESITKFSVWDYRLRSRSRLIDAIGYETNDVFRADPSDPRLIALLAAEEQRRPRDRIGGRFRLNQLLLVVAALLPVALYLFRKLYRLEIRRANQ